MNNSNHTISIDSFTAQPQEVLGFLDRNKPITSYGNDIIRVRVQELLQYQGEGILLETLSWEELINFAENEPTEAVRTKSRKIINQSEKFSETYEAKSNIAAEIEKSAQIFAYVEKMSSSIENKGYDIANKWKNEYKTCVSNDTDYIIDNHQKEIKKWKESGTSLKEYQVECKANYTYSLLMVKVFECALKIDPYLRSKVEEKQHKSKSIKDRDRIMGPLLFQAALGGSSNECEGLLGGYNSCNKVSICITGSVILIVTGLALGLGLGLGLHG